MALTAALLQAESAPVPSLLDNPDFSRAGKDPTKPEGWHFSAPVTWQTVNGVSYIHMASEKPGKRYELSPDRRAVIPPGTKALRVTIRYRTAGLVSGKQKWFDARTTFDFLDGLEIEAMPIPQPLVFSAQAHDWTTATRVLAVPDGATTLGLKPELDQVQAGVLDIAEIRVTQASETDLASAAKTETDPVPADPAETSANKNAAEVPIRHDGPRTILGYGEPTVWFIRPYVDVMGHNFADGIRDIIKGAKAKGHLIAIGVAMKLDDVQPKDAAGTTYVFSYKNVADPLPAQAKHLIFVNTWLTAPVAWPAGRKDRKDLVIISADLTNNDFEGKSADKQRWKAIAKDDPSLTLTLLPATGYYLPLKVWTTAVLNFILD